MFEDVKTNRVVCEKSLRLPLLADKFLPER